jgi:hypothetical protein
MTKWILDRAREISTWIGLVKILTAAGIGISPELGEAIAALGIAIGGFIAVITKG